MDFSLQEKPYVQNSKFNVCNRMRLLSVSRHHQRLIVDQIYTATVHVVYQLKRQLYIILLTDWETILQPSTLGKKFYFITISYYFKSICILIIIKTYSYKYGRYDNKSIYNVSIHHLRTKQLTKLHRY